MGNDNAGMRVNNEGNEEEEDLEANEASDSNENSYIVLIQLPSSSSSLLLK